MGILTTILPTVSTAAQHGQSVAQTGKPAVNAAQQAVQSAVTSGQAAIVHLSGSSPKKVATYGESRSVDSSFEKQRIDKDQGAAKEKEKTSSKASVDVSA